MAGKERFDHILGLVGSVFDAYSTVLFLRTEPSDFTVSGSFSLGDHVKTGSRITEGEGLVGWLIKTQEPLLVNNVDREEGKLGYYTRNGESLIKSFMGCPLRHGQGALCVDSKSPYAFSTKDQKLLHQFAQLVESLKINPCAADAGQLEQRYYQCLLTMHGLRDKHPRWTLFLRHFLDILSEYSGFSHCCLAARDEMGQGYFLEGWNTSLLVQSEDEKRKIPIASGQVGWVFRNHSPLLSGEHELADPGSPLFGKGIKTKKVVRSMCLPLVVHRKTRGVLILADQNAQTPPQQLKPFLFLIADQLALFLENLYLKNRLRRPG